MILMTLMISLLFISVLTLVRFAIGEWIWQKMRGSQMSLKGGMRGMNWDEWKEREKMYACWLCNFPYIGNKQLHRLSEICGGPEGVYLASTEIWGGVLSPEQVTRLKEYTARWPPGKSYDRMREQGIRIVTVKDTEYPKRLKDISDAPYGLFIRGTFPEENVPAVAVIGARECSEYGKYVAKQLGAVLGRYHITVISGMARGIDCISQESALEAGGSSVGVLGCGVDICYPAQNRELYNRLARTGAVLSSYPLGTPALPQNFPPRNRIVSGLADVVVVVEARVKSGTLITVDMALEQGREVYVVPGRVTDRLSDGCNRLLRQGAGALLDMEEFVEEVWELYQRKGGAACRGILQGAAASDTMTARGLHLPSELAVVYQALDFSPRSAEEIREKLPEKCREQQIVSCLMRLCVEKLAIQISPGRFCRTGEESYE